MKTAPIMGNRPCQDYELFHHYKDTGLYGAWVRMPSTWESSRKPRRLGERVYIGCFSTFSMAARMQDRAMRKIKPSGPFNFKASDYDEDRELRRNLSDGDFMEMLRKECHRKYTVVAKSDCYLKFARMLEEEIALAEQQLKVTRASMKKLKQAGKEETTKHARKKAFRYARKETAITDLPSVPTAEVTEAVPTAEVTEAALSLVAIFQSEVLTNSSAIFPAKRNGVDGAEGSGQITNKPITRSAKRKEVATSSASAVPCSFKEKACATTRSVKRHRS